MKTLIIFLAAIALLLAGCGPRLQSGVIFMKEYRPERRWTTTERHEDRKTGAVWYETENHHEPEQFILTIRGDLEGKVKIRDVRVDSATYHKAKAGYLYHYGDVNPPPAALESQ